MDRKVDISKALEILHAYGVIPAWTVERTMLRFSIICPFHVEDSPSCAVKLDEYSFYCFACHKGGTLLDLVAKLEQLSQPDLRPIQAVAHAIQILKGAMPVVGMIVYEGYRKQVTARRTEEWYEEQRLTSYKFYQSLTPIDWHTPPYYAAYLLERGYTPEVLNSWGVRFNQVGINPVVIPLWEQGRFVGYVSRRIDKEKSRKYKNNIGLNREHTLIGNLREGAVLVTEGTLDMLRALQHGAANTCCLLGNMPSHYHLETIARYAARSIVVWATDNDKAGADGYSAAREYFDAIPSIQLVRMLFPLGAKDIGDIESGARLIEYLNYSIEKQI